MREEQADYPKQATCGNCGQTIWVHWSWDKKKEYVKDVESKVGTQWHPCRNWQAGVKYLTEEQQQSDAIAKSAETRAMKTPRKVDMTDEKLAEVGFEEQYGKLGSQQSGLKVSKIIIEYHASKTYEKKTGDSNFGNETTGEWNSLKLGVEIDVDIADALQVENATKDYVVLLRNSVKRELGL